MIASGSADGPDVFPVVFAFQRFRIDQDRCSVDFRCLVFHHVLRVGLIAEPVAVGCEFDAQILFDVRHLQFGAGAVPRNPCYLRESKINRLILCVNADAVNLHIVQLMAGVVSQVPEEIECRCSADGNLISASGIQIPACAVSMKDNRDVAWSGSIRYVRAPVQVDLGLVFVTADLIARAVQPLFPDGQPAGFRVDDLRDLPAGIVTGDGDLRLFAAILDVLDDDLVSGRFPGVSFRRLRLLHVVGSRPHSCEFDSAVCSGGHFDFTAVLILGRLGAFLVPVERELCSRERCSAFIRFRECDLSKGRREMIFETCEGSVFRLLRICVIRVVGLGQTVPDSRAAVCRCFRPGDDLAGHVVNGRIIGDLIPDESAGCSLLLGCVRPADAVCVDRVCRNDFPDDVFINRTVAFVRVVHILL